MTPAQWNELPVVRMLDFSEFAGPLINHTADFLREGFLILPSEDDMVIEHVGSGASDRPSSSHQITLREKESLTIRFVPLLTNNAYHTCTAKAFSLRLGTPETGNRVTVHYSDGTSERFTANSDAQFTGIDSDANAMNNFQFCSAEEECPYRGNWFMGILCPQKEISRIVIQTVGNTFEHTDISYVPGQSCFTCGDAVCNGTETCQTCAADCGACQEDIRNVCGDGICNSSEDCNSCPSDCGACLCGDGACNTSETCQSCAADCGTCTALCGDGICQPEAGENYGTCPFDCVRTLLTDDHDARCGDLLCSGMETCSSCPQDCGVCIAVCGDGICMHEESCTSCPQDCGACGTFCGDGLCTKHPSCEDGSSCLLGESCSNCIVDCGFCPVTCGDKICEGTETEENCPSDCPQVFLPAFSIDEAVPASGTESHSLWNASSETVQSVLGIMQTFIKEESYPFAEHKLKKIEQLRKKKKMNIIDRYVITGLFHDLAKADEQEVERVTEDIYSVLLSSGLLTFDSSAISGGFPLWSLVEHAHATGDASEVDAMNRALIAAKNGDIEQLMKLLPDPEISLPEIQEDINQYADLFDDRQTDREKLRASPKDAFRQMRAYQEMAQEMALDPSKANLSTEDSINALIARNAALAEVVGIAPQALQKDLQIVRDGSATEDVEGLLSLLGIIRFIRSTANFDRLEERMDASANSMRGGWKSFRTVFMSGVSPGAKAADILIQAGWSEDHVRTFSEEDIERQAEIIAGDIVDRNRENMLLMRLGAVERTPHNKLRSERDAAFRDASTLEDLRIAIELHGRFLTLLEKDVRSRAFIIMRMIYATQDWLGIG